MMVQHTYIDCSPKPLAAKWSRSDLPSKTWSQGNTLITIALASDCTFQVVFRRPVGITVFETVLMNERDTVAAATLSMTSPTEPDFKGRPRSISASSVLNTAENSVRSAQESTVDRTRSMSIGDGELPQEQKVDVEQMLQSLDPTFLLLQFQPYPISGAPTEPPIPLGNDDMTARAISVLDRTPSIDLHKIGVVFVGPGQTTEPQILSNAAGSYHYTLFLSALGKFVPLSNNRDIYTGGLDTSSDCLDGPYGLLSIPDQRLSQMIFHVATMMPTQPHDPSGTAKKRHIGNDYVMIVWNEGGAAFDRETIPGQFNLVHIIVEPVQCGHHSYNDSAFKIRISLRSDMPVAEPLPQLLSGKSLGGFVRQISIYYNMLAQVFIGGETSSNSRERLRQIRRIKSRLDGHRSAQPLDFTYLSSQ
ncbi:Tuberous sclerosis 2-like protein [Kappamyces sp. JEL0680]|nr:Tuberous sclerosis 2-like protein [Kappamyces sp. JEL0680]